MIENCFSESEKGQTVNILSYIGLNKSPFIRTNIHLKDIRGAPAQCRFLCLRSVSKNRFLNDFYPGAIAALLQ